MSYHCPHCQAPLAGVTASGTWLRCPKCGRAVRPQATTSPAAAPALTAGTVPTPPAPSPTGTATSPSPAGGSPALAPAAGPGLTASPVTVSAPAAVATALPVARPNETRRVVLASALFVAVTLLAFCYMDGSVVGTALFGAVAFGLFVLLALPPHRAD